GSYLVDVHIVVNERLSVSEGHRIAEYVRLKLIDSHDDINNALVHVDPEDDSVAVSCANLPLRREVLADLRRVWPKDMVVFEPEQVVLHYLSGKVHVDLAYSIRAKEASAEQLSKRLQEQARVLDYIGHVRVYWFYPATAEL
ncbi:MAG: cation transporter dimerization domain-containing protein, partial [Spongiibacteraceae bacterium]|nr:cation transporter dimerization domain-containing protein [Spongiibacteraceae bacterium]